MRLSKHSKMRMRERTPIKRSGKLVFFRQALQKGLCYEEAKNKKMSPIVVNYLWKMSRKQRAIIYKDYLFIYSKGNHTLYTIYEIPDEIKEALRGDNKE